MSCPIVLTESVKVLDLADHYKATLLLLDEVASKREDLADEYAGPARPARISQLHQDIGSAKKLAEIHATLAVATALQDIRQAIEVGR